MPTLSQPKPCGGPPCTAQMILCLRTVCTDNHGWVRVHPSLPTSEHLTYGEPVSIDETADWGSDVLVTSNPRGLRRSPRCPTTSCLPRPTGQGSRPAGPAAPWSLPRPLACQRVARCCSASAGQLPAKSSGLHRSRPLGRATPLGNLSNSQRANWKPTPSPHKVGRTTAGERLRNAAGRLRTGCTKARQGDCTKMRITLAQRRVDAGRAPRPPACADRRQAADRPPGSAPPGRGRGSG